MIPALADLEGTWRTVRVIRHADGAVARFDGQTVWWLEGDRAVSRETGWLHQGGASFEARRETLWRAHPDGVDIRFADGRPFHHWDASGRAIHDCPPDIYRLRYDVSAWPHWSVRWHVTGPRKAYRALTRYRRA